MNSENRHQISPQENEYFQQLWNRFWTEFEEFVDPHKSESKSGIEDQDPEIKKLF
jgi:hypothetical protein